MSETQHFKTQPGPVAKNATPRLPAGNWTLDTGSLDQRSTDWPTEAVAVSLGAGSVQVVMPVKYKSILKIIIGIYTRCQQILDFLK